MYANAFVYLPKFRFDSRLATWIGRIAYNACLAYLKRKKQRPEEALPEGKDQELTSETFGRIDSKQLSMFLLAAIDQLPPVHKTLIVLYHQEELDYLEIGRITGLPQGTVKSYLFRALRQLKQLLTIRYKSGDL